MGDTKQDGVLECKNCLKRGSQVDKRIGLLNWIASITACSIAGYFSFFSARVLLQFIKGDLSGSAISVVIAVSALFLLSAITIVLALRLVRDLQKRDYFFFLDQKGRLHCDTIAPLLFENRYYWQMKSEVVAIQGAIEHDEFLVSSEIIHWQVGGLRQSFGRVIELDNNITGPHIPPNVFITHIALPGGRPFHPDAKITVRNSCGFEVTARLIDILEYTKKNPQSMLQFANAVQRIVAAEKTAKVLGTLANKYQKNWDETALLCIQLGRFLVARRNAASAWPQNSKYAREERKAIDEFLAGLNPEDVALWKEPTVTPVDPPTEETPSSEAQTPAAETPPAASTTT